jgi:hypothetical protein
MEAVSINNDVTKQVEQSRHISKRATKKSLNMSSYHQAKGLGFKRRSIISRAY